MARGSTIPIRMSEAERQDLQRAAARLGMSLSGFTRSGALVIARHLTAREDLSLNGVVVAMLCQEPTASSISGSSG